MVKYEWDESNGVSVPTNKLMAIDADEYYVGMPLKKVDAETVAPTDGDPEYICLAQRNAGDEIKPLQIPVQEVFPDAVYTKRTEDGNEEQVRFGGGGKIKPEQLPDGYPYEEETYITMAEEQSVRHSGILKSSIDGYCNSKGYLDGTKIIVGNTYVVYVDGVAYKGVAYEGAVSSMTKKVCIFSPNGNDFTNAPVSITVGNSAGGTTCNVKFSDGDTHTVKVELYEYKVETLAPKFLPDGYPYDAGSFHYDNSGYQESDELIGILYKASDDAPAYEELLGARMVTPYGESVLAESDITYEEGAVCMVGEFAIITYKDNCVFNDLTFPTSGIYLPSPNTFPFAIYKSNIKTIDPKFLPKITIVQDGYDNAAMGVMATATAAYTCTANATLEEVVQMLVTKTLPPIELYACGDGNGNVLKYINGASVNMYMGEELSLRMYFFDGGVEYVYVNWYADGTIDMSYQSS